MKRKANAWRLWPSWKLERNSIRFDILFVCSLLLPREFVLTVLKSNIEKLIPINCCFFYKKFIQTVSTICWQVAEQYSEDKARQGGNLGWQTRGQMVGFMIIIINILTITVVKLEKNDMQPLSSHHQHFNHHHQVRFTAINHTKLIKLFYLAVIITNFINHNH